MFFECARGDEFAVAGDQLDGAFGQLSAFWRVLDGFARGDPDDQPRQEAAREEQPGRERGGGPDGRGRGDGDGGGADDSGDGEGQPPPQDGVLQSVHIGHEPRDEVTAGVAGPGREGLVDAGAEGAEPPQDDLVPGEPFGVPEATPEKSERPDGNDGHGERSERRPFGGAEEQPGGGGHEGESGEFGSGAEEGGAEEPESVTRPRTQHRSLSVRTENSAARR